MPAPVTYKYPAEAYATRRKESETHGEHNDCSVIAVSVACGITYQEAHKAMAEQGRKNNDGSNPTSILKAIRMQGFHTESVEPCEIIDRYPGVHSGLRHITTHHPERFAKHWPSGTYVVFTRGHVAAIVDGVTVDWTHGRARRVKMIYKISAQNV